MLSDKLQFVGQSILLWAGFNLDSDVCEKRAMDQLLLVLFATFTC
ncbi:MAG: hypothetical protein QOH96_731, partial [Blastocatellia bacterium]|nr:hypothetical protein [Blastocatellia bacterium]